MCSEVCILITEMMDTSQIFFCHHSKKSPKCGKCLINATPDWHTTKTHYVRSVISNVVPISIRRILTCCIHKESNSSKSRQNHIKMFCYFFLYIFSGCSWNILWKNKLCYIKSYPRMTKGGGFHTDLIQVEKTRWINLELCFHQVLGWCWCSNAVARGLASWLQDLPLLYLFG